MQLMFDLDGTLTDSRLGITRCMQYALAEAGVAVPPIEDLTPYVGPPLRGSLATLLGTSDARRIEESLSAYRRRFEQVGIFENQLYPGIVEALEALDAAGHWLSVVTAKPRVYARRIVDHFGIARRFRHVVGPELTATNYTKASLIREACSAAPDLAGATVMVGDRAEDILGARSNGIGSIAVTWGYGTRAELEAARPDHLVTSPPQLLDCIMHGA